MKSTNLLNYAREAGIILREMMKMEWILVVVRDSACFLLQCAFFIEYNGILGVLEFIFVLILVLPIVTWFYKQ